MFARIMHLAGLSLVLTGSVSGCSASPPVFPDAFEHSVMVFVGRVLEYSHYEGPAILTTDEIFKGKSQGASVAIYHVSLGNCNFNFRVGDRYLVFASSRPDGKLATRKFSGTMEFEHASVVLRWLRGRTEPSWNTQLLGMVSAFGDPASPRKSTPVSNLKVTIAGAGKTFSAATDRDGIYQIGGIPPGDYEISASLPGYKVSPRRLKVGECCAFEDLVGVVDGHISGRVITNQGTPPRETDVELVAKTDYGTYYRLGFVRAAKDGTYAFDGVPPGSYLVGVNLLGDPSRRQPYTRTRIAITLTAWEDRKAVDIALPEPLAMRSVVVHVLPPEGGRATSTRVVLAGVSAFSPTSADFTDQDGVACVTWVKGMRFRLMAEAQGAGGKRLETAWLTVEPGDDPVEATVRLK